MAKTKTVASVLVVGGAIALGWLYPPARLFALKAVGRAPVCPMNLALGAADGLQTQIKFHNQILGGSKVIEKDPAGYHLVETPRGKWWIPSGNDFVLPFNLAEEAREIYGTGEYAVRSGDVALDCGANVGVWTRTALDHGARLVVAFEPAPENIESYRRNFKPEIEAGRVILVPKGVWDKEDVLLLKRDPSNSAADSFVMLKDGAKGVEAPLTTIDRVMQELKIDKVDYIKMDIEGAEVRALHGAANIIAKSHPRMSIAAEHLPTDEVRIPEAVRGIWPGYQSVCGPCFETKDGHVRPYVLYFH